MRFTLPLQKQIRPYSRQVFAQDLIAAIVVSMLLIPQSLAYAMLAGLPPEIGLYSSIFPLVFYALFGSSSTLSVGPVAIVSLMTATALGDVASLGSDSYLTGAMTLALLSGLFLTLLGVLKLGVISNFLSHGVISGFISASAIIIAFSQVQHLLGVSTHGDTLLTLAPSLIEQSSEFEPVAITVGFTSLIFLWLCRRYLQNLFEFLGLQASLATLLSRLAPILAVIISIAVSFSMMLEDQGLAVTGSVPSGLPVFSLALPSLELIELLWLPALMISLIGYIESISISKTFAAKRRQRIDADQELIGLGAANLASGFSGGMPVTGGFSRSVVNFDAGAQTQIASILAAVLMLLACLFLTPLLYHLPKATLAATIIIAIIPLIDFSILRKTFAFSKSDYYAVLATIIITLLFGVEAGVASGVALSIGLYLYRTSRPHIAVVGLVEGTEHFRNVDRFKVITDPKVLSLRIDESLFFANASHVEERVLREINQRVDVAEVVLQFSAINELDFSALELLEELNQQLIEMKIRLHLSEVKGPVMDKLKQTGFLKRLSGEIFLSQYAAFQKLSSHHPKPDAQDFSI